MLKLRTKTEFTVPTDRGTTTAIVRLIIDSLSWDVNNVIAKGYYYYFDTEGVFHQLDKIETLVLLEDLALLQASLPALESSTDIVSNTLQRLSELTFYKLGLESGTNYGTAAIDYELDIEEPIAPEE